MKFTPIWGKQDDGTLMFGVVLSDDKKVIAMRDENKEKTFLIQVPKNLIKIQMDNKEDYVLILFSEEEVRALQIGFELAMAKIKEVYKDIEKY